jgi:hypothetical protein
MLVFECAINCLVITVLILRCAAAAIAVVCATSGITVLKRPPLHGDHNKVLIMALLAVAFVAAFIVLLPLPSS